MAGALAFGEALAAAAVALIYSGGTFLESYADGQARLHRRCADFVSARTPGSDCPSQG